MKNLMMIGSALLVLSSSAYASQARLLALGMNETDNEGMYHISDERNIFLNPAYINIYNNMAIAEWGSVGSYARVTAASGLGTTGTSTATLNDAANPKAQGGVFKKYGDYVYGLYLGNESNTSSLLRVAGTSAASTFDKFNGAGTVESKMLSTADNQVDLFFGGDNGLKWAINPVLTFGKDETRGAKDSGYSVRGGVIASNWDAHLNLSLGSKSEAYEGITSPADALSQQVSDEFKGSIGFHIGGSYILSGKNRVFGYVKHYGWEQTDNFASYATTNGINLGASAGTGIGGQQGTVKGDFTSYYLGWGSEYDVNTTDRLFYSLAAKKTDINLEFSNKSEVRNLILPLTIGYEAQALEWLTLRGSVVQNLWGTRDNKNINNYTGATGTRLNRVASGLITGIYGGSGKTTITNSTKINAGATLKFGQFSVDGLIGATSGSRAGAVGSNTNTGALAFDNLETSVAMTYKF